jgi:hypothetical protein
VFAVPETTAFSVTVSDGCNVAVAGATETATGDTRTTVAVPKIAGFVTLAALTTMVWPLGIESGARYNPLDEIVLMAGKSDQPTPDSPMPFTVGLKFWVPEAACANFVLSAMLWSPYSGRLCSSSPYLVECTLPRRRLSIILVPEWSAILSKACEV